MASKTSYISLVMLVVLMFYDRARAQSGCTNALVGLSPCLNYVSGNSSTPSPSCCSQLKGVVQSQPWCLCALLKGGSNSYLGIVINQTQALQLPGACNVQTPPVSQCDASNNGPASAATPASPPSESPAEEMPESPTSPWEPDIPLGTGSKTVPRTDGSSNGGSNTREAFSFLGIYILLLTLSCAFSAAGF